MAEAKRKEFTLRLEDEDAEQFREDAFQVRAKNQEILYRAWKFWREHGRPMKNTAELADSTRFPQNANNYLPPGSDLSTSERIDLKALRAFLSIVLTDPAMRKVVAQSLETQVAAQADVEHHSDTVSPSAEIGTTVQSGQGADGEEFRKIDRTLQDTEELAQSMEEDLEYWRRDHGRVRKRDRKTGS